MKKILSIIFTNIILILLFFFILDYYGFSNNSNNFKSYLHDLTYKGYTENIKTYQDDILNAQYTSDKSIDKSNDGKTYRPVENPNSKKKILIFGCSYANGQFLQNNETFSHFMGKETNYGIYNRSYNGRGVQHMLYQLENKNFSKPDYIIYVFIPHHIRRCWNTCIGAHRDFYYKNINNKLVINSPTPERYISGFFENIINKSLNLNTSNKYNKWETKFYFQHITQSLNTIKEHWGNDVKFIIFAFDDFMNDEFYFENLKNLEKQGVVYVRLSELSDKNFMSEKYKIENDGHPNTKFWEEVTPLFVKHLKNKGYLK